LFHLFHSSLLPADALMASAMPQGGFARLPSPQPREQVLKKLKASLSLLIFFDFPAMSNRPVRPPSEALSAVPKAKSQTSICVCDFVFPFLDRPRVCVRRAECTGFGWAA